MLSLRRSFTLIATLVGSILLAGPAFADAPVKDAKEKVKEERKEAKDAKKSGDPAAIASAKKELTQAEQDLKAAKKKKHLEQLAEARAKWGDTLKKPGVKEEMKLYAKRLSRLRRMAKLATAAKKDAVVKRANTLIEKEKARHEKKMEELKAQTTPAGSASAAPSAPAAAATTGGAK